MRDQGFWAEVRRDYRQLWPQVREDWLRMREEWREMRAEINEARHWDLRLRQEITGKQSPTRNDVRRAVREHRREQRKERGQ